MGLDGSKEYDEEFFACLTCFRPAVPIKVDEGEDDGENDEGEDDVENIFDFSGFSITNERENIEIVEDDFNPNVYKRGRLVRKTAQNCLQFFKELVKNNEVEDVV